MGSVASAIVFDSSVKCELMRVHWTIIHRGRSLKITLEAAP